MFETIGRISIRLRWLVLAFWVAAPIVAVQALPSLSSVTRTNNSQFLSAAAPSQQAADLATPFQGANGGASAIIVASRASGPLTTADTAAIGRVEHAAAAVPGVTSVHDQGASADGRARKALVATAGSTAGHEGPAVEQIRADFASAHPPAGLDFHLTGPLAQTADAQSASSRAGSNIRTFTLLFVIALLFLVYRALLAPLVTLLPAVVSLVLSQPLIAEAAKHGMPMSPVTAQLLTVLLLGAGTDYGLFLVFRTREEIRGGSDTRQAVVKAMGRVGESITFSAITVILALLCLLLASFGIYRGLGPALAIGLGVLLLVALTLLPALLSIFGKAVFWPAHPASGQQTVGLWGHLAERVIRHPVPTLLAGIALFAALSAGLIGFRTGGFTSNTSSAGSDSAAGTAVVAQHFPAASNNPESLLLHYAAPVWNHPETLTLAQARLTASGDLHAVTGPLDPNGHTLSTTQLTALHAELGPAAVLPPAPPPGTTVPAADYQAYRATAQFISPDGRTLQLYALPAAGPSGSQGAIASIPALRATLAAVAHDTGAQTSGIAGQDAASYDISHTATSDLWAIMPIVLAAIAILLAILLRSLVAPWYLIATVGLSYLASLGFAMIVFVHLGGDGALNFVIPFLLFIFAMALGEDYNILLMSRIREEAHRTELRAALTRAIGRTGGTITSAGLILAGTFTVLAVAGDNDQSRQLGFTIAFAVLLDTFFVRTLLVPSIAVLLGRWNWWPSQLSRPRTDTPAPTAPATMEDRHGHRP